MKGLAPGQDKAAMLSVIFGTVAEQEPRHALTLLESLGHVPNKDQLLTTIFGRWGEGDPPGAAVALAKVKGAPSGIYRDLGSKWAAKSPREALAWAQGLSDGQRRGKALEGVVQAWAAVDGQAAAAFALGQTGSQRQRLLDSVVEQWGTTDMSGVTAWANQLTNGRIRTQAIQKVVEAWAKTDPSSAAAYVLASPPDQQQGRLLAFIGEQWVRQDPEGAVNWAQQLPVGVQREVGSSMVSELVNHDPEMAATMVMSLAPSVQNETVHFEKSMVEKVSKAWAEADVAGAITWVTGIPDGPTKYAALQNVVSEWAAIDPKQAVAYVSQNLPPEEQARKDACQMSIAGVWSRTNPQEAAAWAVELANPATMQGLNPLMKVLEEWAAASPRDAATYAANLPPALAQIMAPNVAADWADSDPSGASQWAASFPQGQGHDAAIESVARAWEAQDPSSALNWITPLIDMDKAAQKLDRLLSDWVSRDPVAAKSWIEGSSIPEDTKQKMLGRYSKH